jgi:pimeloyl-ACP methyl ester carboxylesterase
MMLSLPSIRGPLAWVLAVALFGLGQASAARGAQKGPKKVSFKTADGVEIQGTFFPSAGDKKKDACVLLLHDFDKATGGDSHKDGWDKLAEELQKQGYTVLSFDFRGHGDSKTVKKDVFWDPRLNPQNRQGIKTKNPTAKPDTMPDTIDHKEFQASYYPYLVNDVAAARLFLDLKNESGEVNSGNLYVIGAGQAAIIGALWMNGEWKRQRDKNIPPDKLRGLVNLDEAEGKDLAGAVWLTPSPTLARLNVPEQRTWFTELGKRHKVPMLFVYGKKDKQSRDYALSRLKAINPNYELGKKPTAKGLEMTRDWGIEDTNLTGGALLQKSLSTISDITFYLNDLTDKRGSRPKKVKTLESQFLYVMNPRQMIKAKADNDEVPALFPLRAFMMR